MIRLRQVLVISKQHIFLSNDSYISGASKENCVYIHTTLEFGHHVLIEMYRQ